MKKEKLSKDEKRYIKEMSLWIKDQNIILKLLKLDIENLTIDKKLTIQRISLAKKRIKFNVKTAVEAEQELKKYKKDHGVK